MKQIRYKLTGVTPMIHSNPQAADPLNEYAITLAAMTKKRGKTEDDQLERRRIQFLSSIHFNKSEGYIVPADMIWSSIHEAAKTQKMGKKVEKGLVIMQNSPIKFKHSNLLPEELYKVAQYVDIRLTKNKVNNSMVVGSHIIYPSWEIEFEAIIDESMLDEADIDLFVDYAAKYCGLGSRRPRYGRFEVKKIN